MVTTDPFPVYPNTGQNGTPSSAAHSSTRNKELQYARILNPKDGNASAYQRLKLVMDYWCALWYWPVDAAELLPSRGEYFSDLAALLAGKRMVSRHDLYVDDAERDSLGFVDLDSLIQNHPRLQLVRELAERYRFHHWQLEYADLFKNKGGFDVVLGNPPWRKPDFVEQHVIGDTEPQFVTKKLSAAQTTELRGTWLDKPGHREHYIQAYESVSGQLAFLDAAQNYPLLKGMQTNLYKPFICVSWAISRSPVHASDQAGAVGLLHPDSVYDDGKGQALRVTLYSRLRWRLQFENVLHLFEEVDSRVKFSINIYGQSREEIRFKSMANLYSPLTAKKSLEHDGFGPVPGIKTPDNQWELSGHKHRVIPTNETDLEAYAALYDEPGTRPNEARLPLLHTRQLSDILRKLAAAPRRMRDLDYKMTGMWHESGAQKDGTMRRETRFVNDASDWILSGPHIFVGNPFYQTPNAGCKSNSDYTRLDSTTLPGDYLPRTNYVPACGEDEYTRRTPQTPWDTLMTDEFRVVMREMLNIGGERTLIPALIPPSPACLHTLVTVGFRQRNDLAHALVTMLSLVTDTLVKISGKGHLNQEFIAPFPFVPTPPAAILRALQLSCLTSHYSEIWEEHFPESFEELNALNWSKCDHRLNPESFEQLSRTWFWRGVLP